MDVRVGPVDVDRGRVGLLVAGLAALAVLLVLGASAATAPSQEVGDGVDRRTLVGVQGGGVGYHEFGEVRLLDGQGETVWTVDNADSYFDVTNRSDGRVMAGFMNSGYEDCGPYESPCSHTGFRILDPDAADPTTFEYAYPVRSRTNSEAHDVEQLPSGEYVISDMDRERIVTVWENGTESWAWQASSHYEPPEDPTRTDWLHINDVDYLGDDRFLVSVRNANQLLVVERGAGVVEVINEDDDPGDDDNCQQFGSQLQGPDPRCGDPDVLDHQHNPQWLGPGAVLVADSDNNRVVELHRNGSEWTVAWELRSADGTELRWPRDADRLANGNTLVTDSRNTRLLEVTENGTVVWSTGLEHIPYEAERLPEGETVGGQRYRDGSVADGPERGGVPVLTPALSLVRAGYPIPYWVGEWHLLAVAVGAVAALGGVGVWGRERRGG